MTCPPPRLPCCRLVVGLGGVLFSLWWSQTRTMSKYISPWHLLLLCSIFALMHWQQLTTEIANVGDPRLVAEQPTARHQLVLQLSNWHSLPLLSSPPCLPAGLQWKTLLSTAWRHQLLNWLCAKSLQTRLMLPPNFSTRHVRNSEVSQTSHLRESLTLRLPYVNYVNWAAFWTVAQLLPATKLVKRKKHCYSCHVQLGVQAHHPVNWTHRCHCQ